jgi:hypothetical protein
MDRMSVTIDIHANNIGPKRVNLRSSLVVANLIATIQDKFNLDGNYVLRLENDRHSLPADLPLDQTPTREGSVLVCEPLLEETGTLDAIQRGVRVRLSKGFKRVYLQETRFLSEFDLMWQPAIIGRRDSRNPSKNRLLAVDLDELEEDSTVSRHHACITEQGGSFFIESVNARNPTFLNDARLRMGTKYPLPPGARIQVGRMNLLFYTIT